MGVRPPSLGEGRGGAAVPPARLQQRGQRELESVGVVLLVGVCW